MARRSGSAPSIERGTPRHHQEIASEDKVLRAFQGVNVTGPRTGIGDDEFYWLENAMPKSAGNLPVVYAPLVHTINYNQGLLFEATVNISNTDYIISFLSDGSATYIPDVLPYVSTQFAAPGTFSAPTAIPYASTAGTPGILIIDPTKGYFDFNVTAPLTLTTISATVKGTSIAAYAGRVWIGLLKTVSFTDVGSYTSFAGAGGSFTINDSYLHNAITALFSTNGFLYIFGDDSIDTLSNVQVAGGVTSFSRVNLTTSIGTSYPQSIFPYYRSLAFANKYGFYLLSGATPQKISDGLDALFNTGALTPVAQAQFAQAQFLGGLVAGSATIFGELCMCWTLRIVDGYTTLYGSNVTRTLIACFFKGRWFFAYPGFDVGQMVSIPANGTQVLHAFSLTGQLYELFAINDTAQVSFLQTKLWDGGDPILDKEVIRAGLALAFGVIVNPVLTVTTDNEYETQPVPSISLPNIDFLTFVNNLNQPLQFQNNAGGNLYFFSGFGIFSFVQGASTTQGGKYFGMSVKALQTDIVFSLLAEQFRSTRPW